MKNVPALLILLALPLGLGAADAPDVSQVSQRATNSSSLNHVESNSASTESGTRATIKGIVTLIDRDRNLLVLQDGNNPTAVRLSLPDGKFQRGDRVSLDGWVVPMTKWFAEYPMNPSGSELRDSFEAPSDWSNYYLNRMRGFLRPAVTGKYTFWIATDDSGELWLSPDNEPSRARRIAFVASGNWTEPRQWTRFPSQQSEEVLLKAGETYYIEALHQEGAGRDSLAVAWQGPGFERCVVDGRYLTPWHDEKRDAPGVVSVATNGILREYWTNFFSADLSVLKVPDESIVTFIGDGITVESRNDSPKALRIEAGQLLSAENFRLVEVEGRAGFVTMRGDQGEFELTEAHGRILVRFQGKAASLQALSKSWVRVRGVWERTSANGDAPAGILWVGNESDVIRLDQATETWSQLESTPMYTLTGSNPEMVSGRRIQLRGRVASLRSPGLLSIEGNDSFQGFSSVDGVEWNPAGTPVEVAMSNSVFVGLAVASHRPSEIATVRFDHVSGLPASLQSVDIGSPEKRGDFAFDNSVYTLRGSGSDIWGGSDHGHFAYGTADGPTEIVARIAEVNASDSQAKVGIMIRESLSPKARWAGVMATMQHGVGLQYRQETGSNAIGALVRSPAKWLRVTRQRNSILVRSDHPDSFKIGEKVDIQGTLAWENGRPTLMEVCHRDVVDDQERAVFPGAHTAEGELHDVTIHDLATAANNAILAGLLPRLRIRGVVTFCDHVGNEMLCFVQDTTGGCSIRWRYKSLEHSLPVGCAVEITGWVDRTNSTPEFLAGGLAVAGPSTMPQPAPYLFDASARDRLKWQWVEVKGVGRSVGANGSLIVAGRGGTLTVYIAGVPASSLNRYVDTTVRVRGVLSIADSPTLLVPSEQFIELEEAAPQNPYELPLFSIGALQDLNLPGGTIRRMKIGGTVTCVSGKSIFVQDESGGARVDSVNPFSAQVGDAIEAVGFPSSGFSGLVLSEGLVRKIGSGKNPSPIKLSADDIASVKNADLVVTLEALLLEQRSWQGRQLLDLQVGQRAFRAVLPAEAGPLPVLVKGSRLGVTGVSQVERVDSQSEYRDSTGAPLIASLELLLRSPADVVLIERPPWWNWKYTMATIALSVLTLAGSFLWIRTLRRQVEQRTHELQETMGKLQKETLISATLAERDRLAGEIHDSLEQGLTAIMMQIDAATKLVNDPDEMRQYLAMARNMAGFSRAEVQHAVQDLQSPMLKNSDLASALRRVAAEITAGHSRHVEVQVTGEVISLPSSIEHHLLRMGQEAIANAVKHSRAENVRVALDYSPNRMRLSVQDDGIGFVPEKVFPSENGHFGLRGLRSRAKKIDAKLTITSQPGSGTTVDVEAPIGSRSVERTNQ